MQLGTHPSGCRKPQLLARSPQGPHPGTCARRMAHVRSSSKESFRHPCGALRDLRVGSGLTIRLLRIEMPMLRSSLYFFSPTAGGSGWEIVVGCRCALARGSGTLTIAARNTPRRNIHPLSAQFSCHAAEGREAALNYCRVDLANHGVKSTRVRHGSPRRHPPTAPSTPLPPPAAGPPGLQELAR